VPITPPPVVEPRSTTVVQVEERTDEIEAERRLDEERRKAEKEAEKKRRDEEKKKRDDAKKKRDDEEKRRDDEAAADRDDPDAASEAPNAAAPGDAPGPQNPPPDTEPTRPSPEPKPLPPAPEPEPSASSVLHRVRVGTFEKRDNAQALATELSGRGFQAVTSPAQVNGKTVYHVQVGAFRNETEARNQQKALERNGYDTTLSSSR
jgi:cell division protein FtsN